MEGRDGGRQGWSRRAKMCSLQDSNKVKQSQTVYLENVLEINYRASHAHPKFPLCPENRKSIT